MKNGFCSKQPECFLQRTHWNILFLILAITVLIYSISGEVVRLGLPRQIDFRDFYVAAQALLHHDDLYSSGRGGYIYPPFFAFLLIPLTYFSYHTAALLWLGIETLLIILTLWLGFQVLVNYFGFQFNRWQALGVCSLAVLLSYNEVRWELLLAQSDTVTLAGTALALYLLDRRPFLAGMILGAVINIKYQALIFLPLLLLRGQWRVVLGLGIGAVLVALLPALSSGWDVNLNHLKIAFSRLIFLMDSHLTTQHIGGIPNATWDRNIGITSGLFRVFIDHGLSTSHVFITALALIFVVLMIFWQIFRYHHIPFLWRFSSTKAEKSLLAFEWYIIWVIMLTFSPQSTMRHFYLLLNVNLLAAAILMFAKKGSERVLIVAAIACAQLALAFHVNSLYPFWEYWSAPGWSLLPFIILLTWSVLPKCRHPAT